MSFAVGCIVRLLPTWHCGQIGTRTEEAVMTAATDVGFVEMRIAKVVGVQPTQGEIFEYVVLAEVSGDRQLCIQVGRSEAMYLAATLGGMEWGRPMTYQFAAALLRALGGRLRQVRIDRLVETAYGATVEVEGPLGIESVDARPSDALNLVTLVAAPVFVALGVLEDCEARRAGDSDEAVLLRRALAAAPMTLRTMGMT